MSYNNEKEKLSQERIELRNKIYNAQMRIDEITKTLSQITMQEQQEILKNLQIEEGSFVVCFPNAFDFHCTLVQGVRVGKVKGPFTECVYFLYRLDDGEYTLSVQKRKMAIKQLNQWYEEFHTYKVSESQYYTLLSRLTALEATLRNIEEYENLCKDTGKPV